MRYRPEIDGLRALAVIPVILFHAGFSQFSAGFLGVDVFFVISGYLITSIILSEKKANTFSLVSFYERRARRILPALYFMLFLVSFFAFLIMLPTQLKEFGESLIATSLFSANIFFWIKTDYWAQSAELTPLLHIWSLGVEEQFYIFFPLLLIFTKDSKYKFIFWSALSLSFFTMLMIRISGNVSEAFYLLPYRAWELIAGAIGVLWINQPSIKFKKWVTFFAFIVLILAFTLLDERTNPIALYGIPILATFLIISLPLTDGVTSKILKNSFLVYIGTISYSLYLFHQPILAILRIATFGPLSLTLIIASLTVIFLMAAISHRFIELPFKNRLIFSNRLFIIYTVTFMSYFLILGSYFYLSEGALSYKLSKMPPEASILFKKFESTKKNRDEIWGKLLKNSGSDFPKNSKLKILFVGDSISEDLFVSSQLSKEIVNKADLRRFDFDDECIKNLVTNGNEIGHDSVPCNKAKNIFLKSSLLEESDVIVIAEAWFSNAKYLDNFLELPEVKKKKTIVYLTHSFSNMTSLLMFLAKSKINFYSSEFKKFVYLNINQRNIGSNNYLKKISSEYNN